MDSNYYAAYNLEALKKKRSKDRAKYMRPDIRLPAEKESSLMDANRYHLEQAVDNYNYPAYNVKAMKREKAEKAKFERPNIRPPVRWYAEQKRKQQNLNNIVNILTNDFDKKHNVSPLNEMEQYSGTLGQLIGKKPPAQPAKSPMDYLLEGYNKMNAVPSGYEAPDYPTYSSPNSNFDQRASQAYNAASTQARLRRNAYKAKYGDRTPMDDVKDGILSQLLGFEVNTRPDAPMTQKQVDDMYLQGRLSGGADADQYLRGEADRKRGDINNLYTAMTGLAAADQAFNRQGENNKLKGENERILGELKAFMNFVSGNRDAGLKQMTQQQKQQKEFYDEYNREFGSLVKAQQDGLLDPKLNEQQLAQLAYRRMMAKRMTFNNMMNPQSVQTADAGGQPGVSPQ